jgi:hypothetical protein
MYGTSVTSERKHLEEDISKKHIKLIPNQRQGRK